MNDLTIFSKVDVDRILKRAAEIEGSDDPGPVTVEELRAIAGEAGFGADAVERAIAEAQQAAFAQVPRNPVQRSGVAFKHLSTVRSIPVELTSDQLMKAVRLFQPYRDGLAHVHLGATEITWRDRKGLRFAVSSGGGVTEVRVYVSKLIIRARRWTGWVESAADRMENLILLLATQDTPRSKARVHLPAPEPAASLTS